MPQPATTASRALVWVTAITVVVGAWADAYFTARLWAALGPANAPAGEANPLMRTILVASGSQTVTLAVRIVAAVAGAAVLVVLARRLRPGVVVAICAVLVAVSVGVVAWEVVHAAQVAALGRLDVSAVRYAAASCRFVASHDPAALVRDGCR